MQLCGEISEEDAPPQQLTPFCNVERWNKNTAIFTEGSTKETMIYVGLVSLCHATIKIPTKNIMGSKATPFLIN